MSQEIKLPQLDFPASYEVPKGDHIKPDDEFRKVVTCQWVDDEVTPGKRILVTRIEMAAEVRLGEDILAQTSEMGLNLPAAAAQMIGERIHDDVWIDVAPLIRDEIEDALEETANRSDH